jgi:diguanylate cyclase (GGDEF)-like protein/PAS domain S-box-containing protein
MNKRISQLIAIGFGLLIALGLATNVFLTLAVHQNLKEGQHIEVTAVEARSAIRSLRADYLKSGSSVATVLLDQEANILHEDWVQEQKVADKSSETHLQRAFQNTKNENLKQLLNRLRLHNANTTKPLQIQLLGLAKQDLVVAKQNLVVAKQNVVVARQFYITAYIPQQREDLRLADAALGMATQDVLDLRAINQSRVANAQLATQRAIFLFVVLGAGSGIFLTRCVSAIVRQAEQDAHANRNMLDYSRDVICLIDDEGRFVEVSPACQRMWGYSPEELRGRAFQELLHPDDVARTTEIARNIVNGISVRDFENRYLHKDGTVVDMLWLAHWSDVEKSIFCVVHNMTERKEAQEKLRTLALYDGLTGLLNRTAIVEHLKSEMERGARESQPLSIVLLDLDHFKQVNDLHGHAAGDAVLKEAAHRMKNSMRSYDKVGRYGGEEFLIVAPGCAELHSVMLAERVRSCISGEPVQSPDGPLDVTCSLGAAEMKATQGEKADALIARADKALYIAKSRGRNRTELAQTLDESASD